MEKEQKPKEAISLKAVEHRGRRVLMMCFAYNKEWQEVAQKQLGATYSRTYKGWWLPESKANRYRIFNAYKGKAWVDAGALYGGRGPGKGPSPKKPLPVKAKDVPLPAGYEELLKRRGYSDNTRETYISLFRGFLRHFSPKPPEEISEEEIKAYLLYLVDRKKASYSTQNQVINAIKFYYEKVLGLEKKEYWIERPRKEKRLPEVLSTTEVQNMLEATANLKHWCMVALLYSAGLRRSEVLGLRRSDIRADRGQVFIRGAKGKKDRQGILSGILKEKLPEYMEQYKPKYWLFEGPKRRQYSGSSVGAVVAKAAKAAGIDRKVTPHMLRHSFATHLMDSGTDTRVIQRLLGHNSILTTSIYTHVSHKDFHKIKSPLDSLYESK